MIRHLCYDIYVYDYICICVYIICICIRMYECLYLLYVCMYVHARCIYECVYIYDLCVYIWFVCVCVCVCVRMRSMQTLSGACSTPSKKCTQRAVMYIFTCNIVCMCGVCVCGVCVCVKSRHATQHNSGHYHARNFTEKSWFYKQAAGGMRLLQGCDIGLVSALSIGLGLVGALSIGLASAMTCVTSQALSRGFGCRRDLIWEACQRRVVSEACKRRVRGVSCQRRVRGV